MKTKYLRISWIVIAFAFLLSVLFYNQVPDVIDSHWDSQGRVNGTMNRFWGMFLLPSMMVGLTILLSYLPKIDPLNPNFKDFQPYYFGFIIVFNIFMLLVHGYVILWNAKITTLNPSKFVIPITGALLYASGVLVNNARRNWFAGIRTPWTLSSETVWNKTHHFGGYIFKGAGILIFLSVLFPDNTMWIILPVTLGAALIPVLYSYVVYRQEQNVLKDS